MNTPYATFIIVNSKVESMTEPTFYKERAIEHFHWLMRQFNVCGADLIAALAAATEDDTDTVTVGGLNRDSDEVRIQFSQLAYIKEEDAHAPRPH